ncbi:MAG: hypothetical protein NZ700_11435 [Gemmataceae bacterium]|nr:hypothetical protein [Gemmataceae bacterium]MDW8265154.1 hypothetical protein [Gemmataceae bacterium]
MPDLINLARAKMNLPAAGSGDDATIAALIAAVSTAIERYCRREFAVADHDELYDGPGTPWLWLRHYPIVRVRSVRLGPTPVLRVVNRDPLANQQARVAVTAAGLELVRVAGGSSHSVVLPFASHPTLAALAAASVAAGGGWDAEVVAGYELWPSADLRPPQGPFAALGRLAEFTTHPVELAGYRIDAERGGLLRAGAAATGAADGPNWPVGRGILRVQYAAGYDPIPHDVQEACAEWVAALYWQTRRDPGLCQEAITGAVSRSPLLTHAALPAHVAGLLRPYRRQTWLTD